MAHPDLDELLNMLIPFAQQMLSKHGEFYPFGSTMTTEGKIEAQAAYDGDDHPPSEQLIEMLTQAFRQQASSGRIRAGAICYDVRTIPPGKSEKTDAICVSAEHENGEAVDAYLPYKKGWFGKITYGEMFGAAREKAFFV